MNDYIRAIVASAAILVAYSPAGAIGASPTPAAPATATSPGSAASLFAQAQIDAASGHNEAARDELKRAAALDPNNLAIVKLLGDVEYRLEHYADAEAAYKAVIAQAPTDRSLHNRLGGVYAAEGRFDEAVAEFRKSLPSSEGVSNLVDVYAEEGKLPELEAQDQLDLDRAASDDPYTRYELATVLEAEKKYADATSLYQQALNYKTVFPAAHNGLGIVYGDLGRYNDAIAEYKIAIQEDPVYFLAWMNWGVELIHTGDLTGAIEKIQKALSINRQFAVAYENLGIAYGDSGDFQKAVELYQQAIAYDPRTPHVYFNLGSDYYNHGLKNLAEAAFIKGLSIYPKDGILHRALGYYYKDRGQLKQAVEQYQLALRYDPTDALAKSELTNVESMLKP